jgi:hypothetical protein
MMSVVPVSAHVCTAEATVQQHNDQNQDDETHTAVTTVSAIPSGPVTEVAPTRLPSSAISFLDTASMVG